MKNLIILMVGVLGINLFGQIETDGWTIRKSPAKGLLTCGSFANDKVGWIGGIGSIIKTTNGGESYQLQWPSSKDEKRYWFNSVAAVSDKIVMVSGFPYGWKGDGVLLRSNDGGNTWKQIITEGSPVEYSGVIFPYGGTTGFVITGQRKLMRSDDGGESWNVCKLPGWPSINIVCKRTIAAATSNILYVVDSAPAQGEYKIIKSTDAGKSWKTVFIPKDVATPSAPFFTDLATAGADHIWASYYYNIWVESLDGGQTWQKSTAPGSVYMRDEMIGYAITSYTVSKTTDGGLTWSKPKTVCGGRSKMSYVIFTSEKDIIVGGEEGTGTYFILDRPCNVDENQKEGILLALDNSKQGTLIDFDQPEDGYVSLRIKDNNGNVVKNLLNGYFLEKGKHTVFWDLSTIDDYWAPFSKSQPFLYDPDQTASKIVGPSVYTWDAIVTPEFKLDYNFSYYPAKKHGIAWVTPDNTGGWLGDHSPPKDAVSVDDNVWVGTFCESGNALLESDLDMKKLWGTGRIKLACPKVLAASGQYIYFIEQGGWLGHAKQHLAMIRVNRQTKEARRILSIPQDSKIEEELIDISGLAVIGNRAFIASQKNNLILEVDIQENTEGENENIKIIKSIKVDSPRRIRPYAKDQLAVITKNSLELINLTDYSRRVVVKGLQNAYGLAVDEAGNFYIGELDPIHQVKVFSPSGRLVRKIGKYGRHKLGKFDKNNLESPTGIAVDANGNVWVCENNEELKRTSVWNTKGICINDVIGPTEYGGGGTLDPKDENRFFYRGKELVRDSQTGRITLKNIIWRLDTEKYRSFVEKRSHNFNGPSPEYPFYKDGKLFFSMWGGYGMGDITTLFVYDKDQVRPVAAAGQIKKWMRDSFSIHENQSIFAWTDLNDDSQVQKEELQTSPDCKSNGAVWGVRMNNDFEIAFNNPPGEVGIAFFTVDKLTENGYPVYKLPTEFKMVPKLIANDPNQVQYVAVDSKGNAIVVSPFIFSMSPEGKINWRYKCRWPGLHAGRNTDATGFETGLLIASERIWGMATTDGDAGDVFCVNGDFGSVEFFTTDGFYLGRAFKDCRVSNTWKFDKSPTSKELANISLGQEHFGGSFQRIEGKDGKPHYRFVISPGGPSCNVIEVTGLDQVKRFAKGKIEVSQKDIYIAEEMNQKRELKRKELKEYNIQRCKDASPDWKDIKSIDGFQLAYDSSNLYLRYNGRDEMATFQNASTSADYEEAFTKGDVLDLKLQTNSKADANRGSAEEGDIRLSFAIVDNKPQAILYEYVVPGTTNPRSFTAPHHSTSVDKISLLRDAEITVDRMDRGIYTLEAKVPLASLKFNPESGMKLAGDVGAVVSDQSGTTRIDRRYWSNKNTRTVSDIPSEARLQPNLWGTFIFQ